MAYYKFYLNASTIADQIRSGEYKQNQQARQADTEAQTALIRRPQKQEAQEAYKPSSPEELAAQYMNLVSYDDIGSDFGEGTSGIGGSYTEEKDLPFTPVAFDKSWGSVSQAVKDIESSGGNYEARGPVVKTGDYKGQRALGAYQVMPGNLPEWSKQALGRSVSEEEFLSNPDIQDAVFLDRMKKAYNKYGTIEDAVSVWFSGKSVEEAGNASDGYTTTPEYIQKFQTKYNDYLSRGK